MYIYVHVYISPETKVRALNDSALELMSWDLWNSGWKSTQRSSFFNLAVSPTIKCRWLATSDGGPQLRSGRGCTEETPRVKPPLSHTLLAWILEIHTNELTGTFRIKFRASERLLSKDGFMEWFSINIYKLSSKAFKVLFLKDLQNEHESYTSFLGKTVSDMSLFTCVFLSQERRGKLISIYLGLDIRSLDTKKIKPPVKGEMKSNQNVCHKATNANKLSPS